MEISGQGDTRLAELVGYAWSNRLIPAIACAVAVSAAGLISLALPKRYTATATILIEPPGGNDPRAATAVSTVYLESLKTYEHLVASDSLFATALDATDLRQKLDGDDSIDRLKKRILKVSKPVNTSLIEVAVTLPSPDDAQRFAQTLAEGAVRLNSSLDRQSEDEILLQPLQIYEEARTRRQAAEAAQAAFLAKTPVLSLDTEVRNAIDLRDEVNLDLARARTSLAAYTGQLALPPTAKPGDDPNAWTEVQIAATNARIQALETQESKLTGFLDANLPQIEKLKREEEAIEAELRAARDDEEKAAIRLDDLRSSTAVRRVRITVLDPGIVPQEPSYPNLPLNLVAAALLALVGSLALIGLRFFQRQPRIMKVEESAFTRI